MISVAYSKSSLVEVSDEFPRDRCNVLPRTHHAVEDCQPSRFMHDNGWQRITFEKPALRIADLTGIQFRAPHAFLRALLARMREGSQWQTCGHGLRLILL